MFPSKVFPKTADFTRQFYRILVITPVGRYRLTVTSHHNITTLQLTQSFWRSTNSRRHSTSAHYPDTANTTELHCISQVTGLQLVYYEQVYCFNKQFYKTCTTYEQVYSHNLLRRAGRLTSSTADLETNNISIQITSSNAGQLCNVPITNIYPPNFRKTALNTDP